jgi:hypothetical protein
VQAHTLRPAPGRSSLTSFPTRASPVLTHDSRSYAPPIISSTNKPSSLQSSRLSSPMHPPCPLKSPTRAKKMATGNRSRVIVRSVSQSLKPATS